jgi:hypothetical protein
MSQTFQSSPFDDLILYFFEIASEKTISSRGVLVAKELRILRSIYISMLNTSTFMNMSKANTAKTSRKVTIEELVSFDDVGLKVVLNYANFISQLNRLGRLLKRNRKLIPDYSRIKFYRNKVVEHWDVYIKTVLGSGSVQKKGGIALPSSFEFMPSLERKKLGVKLTTEFQKNGVDIQLDDKFSVINVCEVDGYSELIYECLEKISPQLNFRKIGFLGKIFSFWGESENKEISKRLIKLLFAFGFPRPINDVETFSNQLVANLSKMKFTN